MKIFLKYYTFLETTIRSFVRSFIHSFDQSINQSMNFVLMLQKSVATCNSLHVYSPFNVLMATTFASLIFTLWCLGL